MNRVARTLLLLTFGAAAAYEVVALWLPDLPDPLFWVSRPVEAFAVPIVRRDPVLHTAYVTACRAMLTLIILAAALICGLWARPLGSGKPQERRARDDS